MFTEISVKASIAIFVVKLPLTKRCAGAMLPKSMRTGVPSLLIITFSGLISLISVFAGQKKKCQFSARVCNYTRRFARRAITRVEHTSALAPARLFALWAQFVAASHRRCYVSEH